MNIQILLVKYEAYDVSYYKPTKTLYINKEMLVKDLFQLRYDIRTYNIDIDNVIIES